MGDLREKPPDRQQAEPSLSHMSHVICRGFKLSSSPTFFEGHSVTSTETLVSKGCHELWDYHVVRKSFYDIANKRGAG